MKRLELKTDRLGGEEGAALILALMMMTLLTLLGMAAVFMSKVDLSISGNEKASIVGQYAAEAGIEDAIEAMNEDVFPLTPAVPEPDATLVFSGLKAQIAPANATWSTQTTGTVGGYSYVTTIKFKPNKGQNSGPNLAIVNTTANFPVALYDRNFGYAKGATKNGYPVFLIHSVATGPAGYQSIVEVELSKVHIPVDSKVKAGVTSNGNVTCGGSFDISGTEHDVDGNAVAGTGLPGADAQGAVTLSPDNATTQSHLTGSTGTNSQTEGVNPALKSIADALGWTEAEGTEFLEGDGVKRYSTRANTDTTLPSPSTAVWSDGGVVYVDVPAGAPWGQNFNFNGILIVHNKYYVPEAWRVSHLGLTGDDYYDAGLDDTNAATYDKFPAGIMGHTAGSAGYAAFCGPAQFGNVNGNVTFKGVVIGDIVNKFNGTMTVIGAVISLGGITVAGDDLTGNVTIKYSSEAVDKYGTSSTKINKKLSWKKMTGYEN